MKSQTVSHFINQNRDIWDPENVEDLNMSPPSVIRIKNELNNISKDPVPGIIVLPDDIIISRIHALIIGPVDTPYECGFFYFLIACSAEYPIKPPKVKLKTTGSGTVRFNPNFYKNGKVCLSIIGTWSGPGWTPALTLSTILLSIQSLFNNEPYFNEPGFIKESYPGISNHYNIIIQHETIRCAVCDVLEEKTQFPQAIKSYIEKLFPNYYDYYIKTCSLQKKYDGLTMNDPFSEQKGIFEFEKLSKRLEILKIKYVINLPIENDIQYAIPESGK